MEADRGAIETHFYLVQQNLISTIDSFNREPRSQTTHGEWHNRMLSAFDSGNRLEFLEMWERYIPEVLKVGEYEKLEFLLQVYFTCLPIMVNDRQGWQRELEPFKEFLNSKGADLCKTTEFLPFYALPHIQQPQNHSTFSKYFTANWNRQLRQRLHEYLKSLESHSFSQNPDVDNQQAKQREEYLKSALIESNSKWTSFAFSLLNMGKQLISHIQGTVEANIPSITAKIIEYEKFLMTSEDSVSNASSFLPVLNKENLAAVNYQSVKKDIFNLRENGRVCALLQALRWRMTKTPSSVRKAILEEYSEQDIFNISENGLSDFLQTRDSKDVEYIIKLANVMAGEALGRSYLLSDSGLIPSLVQILKKERQDNVLRQNSIGILQKLSLRRRPQSIMIQLKVIEWLVNILTNHPALSEYSLEYSSALLMNLSLRTAGKQVCERLQMLPLLGNLMEHENPNVRTYVNGILYSIFSMKSIKDSAKALGFDRLLERIHNNSEEAFKKQILYVLEQMRCDYEDSCYSEDEGEEEDPEVNDDSEMVSDDEDTDELVEYSGLLGEELLKMYGDDSRSIIKPQQNSIDTNSYIDDRYRQSITPASNDFSEFVHAFKPRSKIPRTPVLK